MKLYCALCSRDAKSTLMRLRTGFAIACSAVLLAACATTNPDQSATRAPRPPVPGATAGLSVGERLTLAVELLNHAQRERARIELQAILVMAPGNAASGRLLRDMDEDPRTALGEQSYAYTVRPGDTMKTIASRLLGDPLKFYILARYNGIDVPADVTAGRVLMIPGEPRKSSAPRVLPPVATQPSAPPVAQPGRAGALRALALESMDRGQINKAVSLLQQASELDPSNALIKRDLSRAERIQTTVSGH